MKTKPWTPETEKGLCIQLDDQCKWYLTSDSHNWILRWKENGCFNIHGYYSRLEHAMDDLVNSGMRSSSAKSVGELCLEQKRLNVGVKDRLNELFKYDIETLKEGARP